MMNKKGATSISVFLLVMMALILGATSLIVVIFNDNVEETILDARFIENVYIKEEQLKFFIKDVGEKILEKNEDLEDFRKQFKNEFEKVEVEDIYIQEVKRRVLSGNYDLQEKDDEIIIIFNDFNILMSSKIQEKNFVWVWHIIPAGRVSGTKDYIGVVYDVNLEVKLEKEKV